MFATFPRVVVGTEVVWSLTTDAIAIRHSRGTGHAASASGWYQGSCCTRSVSTPTDVSVCEEECESRLPARDLALAHGSATDPEGRGPDTHTSAHNTAYDHVGIMYDNVGPC